MREFEAILFDFDGVLADTEPVHCACWAEVLAPKGVALTWDYYRDCCIGIDDRDMLRTLARRASEPCDWKDLWALYPAKKELFRARTLAMPPFDAGLDGFLARLHENYRLAVVSSSSSSEIEPLLAAGGLKRHFDTIIGGESVRKHKPDPAPYQLAAKRLDATSALVVEDSEAGIASGRAAGFEVLAIRNPRTLPEALTARLSRDITAA
jgi:HAD superfamily hydrolase (TIGR01509 family)